MNSADLNRHKAAQLKLDYTRFKGYSSAALEEA